MPTLHWIGGSTAIAQVVTVTVAGTLAGETFTLTVGGQLIASVTDTDTDADTVAANLASAWNDSAHPYATPITAAAVGSSSGQLTLTADNPGVPFTITLNTPGGSATFSQSTTTANAGPNDWATDANWSTGSAPTGSDDVVLADSATSILWLPATEQSLNSLTIRQSFTGLLGLPGNTFQVSADTIDATRSEYRPDHLKVATSQCDIGQHFAVAGSAANSATAPAGSPRLKLDFGSTTACAITVHNTAATARESALQPMRLIANHASTTLTVRKGTVGIATDAPSQTATLSQVSVAHAGNVNRDASVMIGPGVTLTTLAMTGGQAIIAAAPTTCRVDAGELTCVGSGTITNLHVADRASTAGSSATVTNTTLYAGAVYRTDLATVTHTNAIRLERCGLSDVTLDLGRHLTVEPTAL